MDGYEPSAADDEVLVGRLNEKLRATIQDMLERALRERRSVFGGRNAPPRRSRPPVPPAQPPRRHTVWNAGEEPCAPCSFTARPSRPPVRTPPRSGVRDVPTSTPPDVAGWRPPRPTSHPTWPRTLRPTFAPNAPRRGPRRRARCDARRHRRRRRRTPDAAPDPQPGRPRGRQHHAAAPVPGLHGARLHDRRGDHGLATPARSAPRAEVLCWGDNSLGQLGDDTTTASSRPRCSAPACDAAENRGGLGDSLRPPPLRARSSAGGGTAAASSGYHLGRADALAIDRRVRPRRRGGHRGAAQASSARSAHRAGGVLGQQRRSRAIGNSARAPLLRPPAGRPTSATPRTSPRAAAAPCRA